jgi:hypothetical protein
MEVDKLKTTVRDIARDAREKAVADERSLALKAPDQAAATAAAAAVAATATAEAGKAKPYTFKALGVDEHGVITGIGAVAENVDLDDEILKQKALVQILKSGKVLAAGEAIPADDTVIGISIEKGKESHWFVGIRPNDDEVLELAKKGGVACFSWGAFVTRTEAK